MLDGIKEKLLKETFEEVIEETGQWTQEEAMYVVVPEIDADCQKCCFYNLAGSCELVEGSIAAEGHCRFWVQPCPEDEVESYSLSQSDPIEELPICLSNGMVRIPIAKKGSWFHDVHGLVSFNAKDFAEIKRESSKEVLGFTPYITYGHPTNLPYESVDAELKKGDLTGWEEKDDVLFGLFDAKEDVVSLINNKDYEYSSGEFLRNYKDKFTGANKGTVLMRVALTNSPFIPFGDTKVEALSTNANSIQDCLPKPISYVIKLSTDVQENINTPIKEDLPEINMSEVKTPDQLAAEVVANLIPEVKEVKPEVSVTPVEVKEAVPVQTAPVIDFNALLEKFTAQALENTKIAVNAVKAESEAVISGLKSQLETVTNQLTETKEITQAFSTSLTNQAKAQEQRELLGNGVSPALIQKFSTVLSAIETKQTVVKLSTRAADGQVVESETPVVKALKELLIDAVHSSPVNLQQFGQSTTKIPAYGLKGAINSKVEENRAKAAKVSL